MTNVKCLNWLFSFLFVCAFQFANSNSFAQNPALNVEPQNPPGYDPGALSPPTKPGGQPVKANQAPPVNVAPPPNAPPQNLIAPPSSGVSQDIAPPPPNAPQEKPPSNNGNFQNPSDISKASTIAPPGGDPNVGAPQAPSYPPPSMAPTSSSPKNKIIDVGERIADKKLFATVVTSMGAFKMKLYPQYAPRTVRNFTDLATGQKEFVEVATSKKSTRPFFNGQIIFKVVRDFVVQMGCPFGDGRGGPGYEIQDEFTPYLHHDKAGMVSMANHGPNTAGSQFFITLGPQPSFDDKYSVFGEVISGMDVVQKISRVKTGPTSRPLKRIVIQKVEIEGL